MVFCILDFEKVQLKNLRASRCPVLFPWSLPQNLIIIKKKSTIKGLTFYLRDSDWTGRTRVTPRCCSTHVAPYGSLSEPVWRSRPLRCGGAAAPTTAGLNRCLTTISPCAGLIGLPPRRILMRFAFRGRDKGSVSVHARPRLINWVWHSSS